MMKTTRRTVAVLGLLLLFVSAVAPQAKRKFRLHGTWEGTGYQTDDNSTWPMKLTTKTLSGRRTFWIDYPSLDCGGRWKLLSSNGSRAMFREHLDHGQDKCTDKGLVRIEKLGNGQIFFLYSMQGRRAVTASAVLNRKGN